MLFDDKKHQRVAEERLVRLLGDQPRMVSTVEAKQQHPDLYRALVISLLLTSVAGTWSVAFFLGHP